MVWETISNYSRRTKYFPLVDTHPGSLIKLNTHASRPHRQVLMLAWSLALDYKRKTVSFSGIIVCYHKCQHMSDSATQSSVWTQLWSCLSMSCCHDEDSFPTDIQQLQHIQHLQHRLQSWPPTTFCCPQTRPVLPSLITRYSALNLSFRKLCTSLWQ